MTSTPDDFTITAEELTDGLIGRLTEDRATLLRACEAAMELLARPDGPRSVPGSAIERILSPAISAARMARS